MRPLIEPAKAFMPDSEINVAQMYSPSGSSLSEPPEDELSASEPSEDDVVEDSPLEVDVLESLAFVSPESSSLGDVALAELADVLLTLGSSPASDVPVDVSPTPMSADATSGR
jgi:hypothetical protein